MALWKKLLSSKRFAVIVAITLFFAVAVIIALTATVLRNAWLNMRISTICPDYFSYEYAWVVDENGQGIDSVAIELWDNSDFNLIYRTFTDSSGRFVLFHDFGSFALYNMPFSYDLFVHVDGWSDTIRYGFEKHRVCHFRKKTGPDTIVCDLSERSKWVVKFQQTEKIIIDTGYQFIPYEKRALAFRRPDNGKEPLPYDTVYYTSIRAGKENVPFAVVPFHDYAVNSDKNILTRGVYYAIDRDGDNNLADEKLQLISASGSEGLSTDCTVQTCRTIDSIFRGERCYYLDLKVREMHRNPFLQVRRADGVSAEINIDSTAYKVFLWDRAGCDYSDPGKVIFGIDLNHDGKIAGYEGSRELFEQVRGRIVLDTVSFRIDTITPDGLRLYCSDVRRGSGTPFEASVGSWVKDFDAIASCPVSLYKVCAAQRYTVLYFFSGNSRRQMEQAEITTLLTLMEEQLGKTEIIGINRRVTGDPYCDKMVINENRGWEGPLVHRFHNHRETEIVCLDDAATVVYRGETGPSAIKAIWKQAGLDDVVALSVFDQLYADREVVVPSK
jgi:hypothetical protein